MTSAQVVETSVNVTSNSPSQDYTHADDHNLPNYDMTPGFKPFTVYVIKPLKILSPIKSTKFVSEVTLMLRSTPILTALVATRLKRIPQKI